MKLRFLSLMNHRSIFRLVVTRCFPTPFNRSSIDVRNRSPRATPKSRFARSACRCSREYLCKHRSFSSRSRLVEANVKHKAKYLIQTSTLVSRCVAHAVNAVTRAQTSQSSNKGWKKRDKRNWKRHSFVPSSKYYRSQQNKVFPAKNEQH